MEERPDPAWDNGEDWAAVADAEHWQGEVREVPTEEDFKRWHEEVERVERELQQQQQQHQYQEETPAAAERGARRAEGLEVRFARGRGEK